MEKVKQTIYKVILVALILGMIALSIVFNVYKQEKEDRDLNYNVISKYNTAILERKTENTVIENNIVENIIENTIGEDDTIIKKQETTISVESIEKVLKEKITSVEEYIDLITSSTYVTVESIARFKNIEDIDSYYLEMLANSIIGKFEDVYPGLYRYNYSSSDDDELTSYTYDDLNNMIVAVLGEGASEKFPKEQPMYFRKLDDGTYHKGFTGMDTTYLEYFIDNIEKKSDGKYYVTFYEYVLIWDYVMIDDFMNEYLLNYDNEVYCTYKYRKSNKVDEEYIRIDKSGNDVIDEDIKKLVKENENFFGKKELVIRYDEEKGLYYLESCVDKIKGNNSVYSYLVNESNKNKFEIEIEDNDIANLNVKIESEKISNNFNDKLEDYIDIVHVNYNGHNSISEFDNIKDADTIYFNEVVNRELKKEKKEYSYSYDKLNSIAVKIFGEECNNLILKDEVFPFQQISDGENKDYAEFWNNSDCERFVIENIKTNENGMYVVTIYEYFLERMYENVVDENEFVKEFLYGKNSEIIYDYDIAYYKEYKNADNDETYPIIRYDRNGNKVLDSDIDIYVLNNKDKFTKKELVIEYNNELDCFYLKSCKTIK